MTARDASEAHPPGGAGAATSDQITCAVVGSAGFLGRAFATRLDEMGVAWAGYTRAMPIIDATGRLSLPDSVSTIFWLATRINPSIADTDPGRVAEDRAAFGALLRGVGGLRHERELPLIVLLSSGGTVYDTALPPPYLEGAATRSNNAYGTAKLRLERDLRQNYRGPGLAIRVSNAYGPGQPAESGQGVIAHWLRAARRGERLQIFGDPSTLRDYVYVEDVAKALHAVIDIEQRESIPDTVNIGSGVPTSLAELADAVRRVVSERELEVRVMDARGFDSPDTYLDVSLADRVLRWQPRVSLLDGLTASWDVVRRLGDPRA